MFHVALRLKPRKTRKARNLLTTEFTENKNSELEDEELVGSYKMKNLVGVVSYSRWF